MSDEPRIRLDFKLYLITDRRLVRPGRLVQACRLALEASAADFPPGTVALQLREKDLPGRELYELARALKKICEDTRSPLLINDRVDAALAAGADGVHLRADSMDVSDARSMLGVRRLIGVSTHSLDEAAAAADAGADFVVFGPVYPPLSKPGFGRPKGLATLRQVCCACRIPVFALGGVTPERVRELAAEGGGPGERPWGVAAIGAVFGQESPGVATRAMLEALKESRF